MTHPQGCFPSGQDQQLPSWLLAERLAILPLDESVLVAAQVRWDSLAKPQGSLGRLEELAVQLSGIQEGCTPLQVRPARMFTIAGDHGVCEEGIAVTPQKITPIMVHNFVQGGAAINSLCRTAGIELCVVDVGTCWQFSPDLPIFHSKVASGTKNMCHEPAMSWEECLEALGIGVRLAKAAEKDGVAVVGLGEMGIGNTTASSALFCAYLGLDAEKATGMGAGQPERGLEHKVAVIRAALQYHDQAVASQEPVAILASLGGLEIAALAGLIIGCAARRIAVMVDGFISTAAFLAASRIAPGIEPYCFFSHTSAESAHSRILSLLGKRSMLDLGLRLGEGTGAALGVMLLQAACDAFNTMGRLTEVCAAAEKALAGK